MGFAADWHPDVASVNLLAKRKAAVDRAAGRRWNPTFGSEIAQARIRPQKLAWLELAH